MPVIDRPRMKMSEGDRGKNMPFRFLKKWRVRNMMKLEMEKRGKPWRMRSCQRGVW